MKHLQIETVVEGGGMILLILLYQVKSVSYTHLDVYKRQVFKSVKQVSTD